MSEPHHRFVADRYGERAADYVASAVHAGGEDLDQIESRVKAWRPARALDLGCGGGHVTCRIAPYAAEVVAIDPANAMLEAVHATARERGYANVTVQQGTAENLPFADAAFDAVLSRFSAHHWTDLTQGVREALRTLKPGAHAIFADVISPGNALRDTHLQTVEVLRDLTHVRNYSAAEWHTALTQAGFIVIATRARRLRMEFATWIARTRPPEVHVAAIRSLAAQAPDDVRRYFEIEQDGSFTLDTATIECRRPL